MTNRANGNPQPEARLTRLELHGFKSFASRTVFRFDRGITAVVGPNGSGKSNIADAVRWVLGETSYNALRSKKTEDVIFAGGRGKAPAGLAEVTVVFNNDDHWLPSEFTEVSVTRRAYRGGDSQYLINGRRVRLKDIAFLTASLGQSYTVVGQGLVDAALSQRPEDRRGLFEHAADLAGLRLKVSDAERNLNEAKSNTERLIDLLTEVEPRLKTLERAARQAREWQGLRDRLTLIQQYQYKRLLLDSTRRLGVSEQSFQKETAEVATIRATIESLIAQRQTANDAISRVQDALGTHDARLEVLREQLRRLTHEREIVEERQGALTRRRADMEDTQSALDEQVGTVEAEQTSVATSVHELDEQTASSQRTVEHLQAAAQQTRQQWSDHEREANEVQRSIVSAERALNELTQRRALIEQRQETGAVEAERLAQEATARNKRIVDIEQDIATFAGDDESISSEAGGIQDRLQKILAQIDLLRVESDEVGRDFGTAETSLAAANNRLDFLQRMQESGSGLHAGARQVMQWQRDGSVKGILGTLSELIAIEAKFDTAIEVALGGHLQDVVVQRWADAEVAIDKLKQSRSGRATFQPLDTVGKYSSQRQSPQELRGRRGVHGVAADLVTADEAIAPVIRSLLGRFVVAEDLPTARELLSVLPNGWSAVTLAGEIARSSGSVTGGAAVRESGVLGRERELRDLPDEIGKLERAQIGIAERRASIGVSFRDAAAEQTKLQADLAGLAAQQRERQGQRKRLDTWLIELSAQRDQAAKQHDASGTSRTEQTAELEQIAGGIVEATARRDAERLRHAQLVASIAEQRESGGEDDARLSQAQRELAGLEERVRAERRRATSLAAQRQALAEELGLRSQRLAELDGEQTAHKGQLARLGTEISGLQTSLDGAVIERVPLAENVATAAQLRETRAGDLESANQDLLTRERSLSQQELVVERARSEHAAITLRIFEDLALEDPETLAGIELEAVDDDDAALTDPMVAEREISRLKERLRRVGYVGEDVVTEYEREAEHHIFLRAQLADVESASTSLRQMLQELHETMHARFEETFTRVAAAFTSSFTTLFGGGTARLVLTTDEDSENGRGGIDIVAQPPGKRLQNLSLLSGGERSLTGVALLFAILRVSPSPFVLLDEVDAALDESNVLRFREQLRVLASETQAIVITHNRGTVEIADTLYGISMGGDGISQMLSLKLSDVPLGDEAEVEIEALVAAK